jgi:Flp pilus assembly protein TadB
VKVEQGQAVEATIPLTQLALPAQSVLALAVEEELEEQRHQALQEALYELAVFLEDAAKSGVAAEDVYREAVAQAPAILSELLAPTIARLDEGMTLPEALHGSGNLVGLRLWAAFAGELYFQEKSGFEANRVLPFVSRHLRQVLELQMYARRIYDEADEVDRAGIH